LSRKDARSLKDDFEKESFDLIIADLPCSAE
jgi:16S rRNA C967 or C1407 C5-methylase (RsmB/RsmF family)